MSIIDNVKEAVTLVQRIDNLDLYRKILDLQAEVMALVEENNDLKRKLQIAEDLVFRENSYWRRSGEGPFCCRCWDAESKLIRLIVQGGFKPKCPNCGNFFGSPNDRVTFG
jgi:hypothetical protein